MTIIRSLLAILFLVAVTDVQDLYARGGGRLGGGNAISKPNVSRPNISKPNLNNRASSASPSLSRVKPNYSPPRQLPSKLPNNVPNINKPNNRLPSKPNITPPAINKPNINRPNGNPPNINLPQGNRPNFNNPVGGNRRPSSNDLKDFLNLPGGRPSTLPAVDRPDYSNRPNVDINRPNIENRPNVDIGNRPQIGNNIQTGDINLNINRQNQINSVRNRWNNVNTRPFHNPNWWNNYPATLPAWRWHAGWNRYPPGWCWRHTRWTAFGTWFVWGAWTTPRCYDYGTTVVYRDNYVYVDNQSVGTTEQYYDQAVSIAESAPEQTEADNIEWMPLGVFAITEENATENGFLLQLAVSKEGLIAGTFWNELNGVSRPVEGTVDKESQRAVWKFSDDMNPEIVMETGVYNLTLDESTALVHHGSVSTETWLLIRLPEDQDTKE